jgi:hypothetical protein
VEAREQREMALVSNRVAILMQADTELQPKDSRKARREVDRQAPTSPRRARRIVSGLTPSRRASSRKLSPAALRAVSSSAEARDRS